MQEQLALTSDSRGTQGTPYTRAELTLIEQLAPHSTTRGQLETLFPQRSPGAVKKKIVEARHRLGLIEAGKPSPYREPTHSSLAPDDPGEDDMWEFRNRNQMKRGNDAFLQALMAA